MQVKCNVIVYEMRPQLLINIWTAFKIEGSSGKVYLNDRDL